MVNTVERVTTLLFLNEITFFTGAPGFLQKSNHIGYRIYVACIRVLLLWLSLFVVKWEFGKYLLYSSLILYALEYVATFFRKHDESTDNVVLCFVVGHLSIFNFVFDRPGRCVNSPFSSVVTLFNVLAVAYSVIYLTYAYDFNAAWGCYGPSPQWKDLDGGYCSTYKDADTSGFGNKHCNDALSSDPPNLDAYHMCKPGANPVRLTRFLHVVISMLSVSVGVYIGSMPTKLELLVHYLDKDRAKKNA